MNICGSKFRYAIGTGVATAILISVHFSAQAGSTGCSDTQTSSATQPTSATQPRSTTQLATTQTAQTGTIVEVAASNDSFTTLVQAIQAAGLAETLSDEGPFTVFAPTNEAFAALPPGTLENLLKPENRETLRRVLTYHVVAGAVESGDIQPGEVASVEGSPVELAVNNGQVKVNDATVLNADIQASNGVIHVIDRVILPPDL